MEAEKAIALAATSADKARLYNILGYIYETAGKPVDAKLSYERAIALDPGFDKPKLNLAYILEQDYQLERAADIYKGMLKTTATNADVWNRLGFTYELMREPKKAMDAYQKAIELNPGLEEAHYNLGMLYQKMDKQKKADEELGKLADMKFQRIEKKTVLKKVSDEAAIKHPLFKYVDVFFALMT
jgi:Flp pilus assembly protein TadD